MGEEIAGLPSVALGRELRRQRRARELTVEELAELAGVSSGLVSQLERGRANPSLSNLQKLAGALGVTLVSLFSPAPSHTPSRYGVVRAGARKQLVIPKEHIVYELLTPDLNRRLEMIRSVVPIDYDTSEVPYEHEGEECVHVLRGRIEAGIGDDRIVLGQGDSVTYDASVPHWWRNVGGEEGELISAVTPPSF